MTQAFHTKRPHARAIAVARDTSHTFIRFAAALMLITLLALVAMVSSARAEDMRTAGQLPLDELARNPAYAFLAQPLPVSHTLSGNYLAGRYAQRRQDWSAAQTYMGEVVLRDSDNPAMLQRTFLLALGAGKYAHAEELAKNIDTKDPAADVANIFLSGVALKEGRAKDALAQLDKLPDDGFGDFTKPLLGAWALAADGRYTDAMARLDATNTAGAESTFAFHRGMIADIAGDDVAATASYLTSMREGLSLHSALVIAAYFERHEAHNVSAKIYEGIDRLFDVAPTLGITPRAQVAEPKPSVTQGAALAVFDIASMLYDRRANDSAQIYASLTNMLAPDMPYASLMMGDIAALAEQYDLALENYATISEKSPLFWLSRLRVAEVYEVSGDLEKSAAVLRGLATEKRTRLPSLVALGDIYRRQGDFANARTTYDEALRAASDEPDVRGPILFSRGMASSRLGDWTAAEKDLMAALELQPDNALLLNFVGYSMIERGQKSDQAFDYIRRAVALKPDDGYILDSYGWALHRRGDTQGAIEWLEKAVAAVPGDATILDHLGDVYWFAGRVTEAQFQWQRARDLTQDQAFREGVDAKIRGGLTQVDPAPQMVQQRDAKI